MVCSYTTTPQREKREHFQLPQHQLRLARCCFARLITTQHGSWAIDGLISLRARAWANEREREKGKGEQEEPSRGCHINVDLVVVATRRRSCSLRHDKTKRLDPPPRKMINQNSFFFLWSSPGSKHSFRPLLRSAPVSSIFFLSFVLCAALQFFQLFFCCRVVVLCAAAAAVLVILSLISPWSIKRAKMVLMAHYNRRRTYH